MSLDRLNEAFKLLDSLNEEMFDTSLDGVNALADMMDDDDNEIVKIIDADAEYEEDTKDSYIGKIIVSCNVCHTLKFSEKEDIEIDDSGVVNGEESCPYCGESEGFTIVGQVNEFGDTNTEDETDKEIPEDEENIDDDASEIKEEPIEEEEDDKVTESFGRRSANRLLESGKSVDFSRIKKLGKKLIKESVDPQTEKEIKKLIGLYAEKITIDEDNGVIRIISEMNDQVSNKEKGHEEMLAILKKNGYTVTGETCQDNTLIKKFMSFIHVKKSTNESADVTDQVELDAKEQGVLTKKKELEDQGYKTISTANGKITMAKPKELTESPYYLDAQYDSRKSFYNKAMVSDNTDDLYSYGVHVMSVENGKPVIKCREDQLSQTTLRHIKEFLKQKGFPAISKQQIIKDYMTECADGECINEDLRNSPYNQIIVRYFDYTGSDRFFDVIADLIDRVEDFSDEEEIWEAIDSGLIYTRDQWEVYMHYCDMGDSTDKMYESLFGDIFAICDEITNSETPSELDESLKTFMKTRLGRRFVEGFNNINVETDEQKLTMTQDENGKVTVTTEPLATMTEGEGAEMDATATAGDETISPIGDDLANELMGDSGEESDETAVGEETPAPAEGEEVGEDAEATDVEGEDIPAEEEEVPAGEEGAEVEGEEEVAEEEDDSANESFATPHNGTPLEEGKVSDWYHFNRKGAKGYSLNRQMDMEDELIDIDGEIAFGNPSDRRRKSLERREDKIKKDFAKQRQFERDRENANATAPTEVDMEINDFDEVSFSTLGEKYLKSVYENVESFSASNVANNDRTLIIEGVITFSSGVQKKTGFIFEAMSATPSGNVRFVGGNKHFSNSNKAFTLNGRIDNSKLFTESFSYNYRPAGATRRVVGKINSK